MTAFQDLVGWQRHIPSTCEAVDYPHSSSRLICIVKCTGRTSLSSTALFDRNNSHCQPPSRPDQCWLHRRLQCYRLPGCRKCAGFLHDAHLAHTPQKDPERAYPLWSMETRWPRCDRQRRGSYICDHRLLLFFLARLGSIGCGEHELGLSGLGRCYAVLLSLVFNSRATLLPRGNT